MNPRVSEVKPNKDYTLIITFNNGEVKLFYVKPYMEIGILKELKDLSIFNSVKPFLGSIKWKNGQDFCHDTLFLESIKNLEIKDSSLRSEFTLQETLQYWDY